MKKKMELKKLRLSKELIAALNAEGKSKILGGATNVPRCNTNGPLCGSGNVNCETFVTIPPGGLNCVICK